MSKIILKQNNLIECDCSDFDSFTELHHDLFNELISIYQNDFIAKSSTDVNLFNFDIREKTLYVKRQTLEKNMSIKRKSTFEIFSILKDIRDTSVILKNFINESGIRSKFKTLSFIESVEAYDELGKHSFFKIEYTKDFAMLCHKQYSLKFGNYTTIHLSNIQELKSKYSKSLIELFDSKWNLSKKFLMSYSDICLVFKYTKKVPLSYISRQMGRIDKEVSVFYDFTYEINKKDKSILFELVKKLR
jgi:hypothetical protein